MDTQTDHQRRLVRPQASQGLLRPPAGATHIFAFFLFNREAYLFISYNRKAYFVFLDCFSILCLLLFLRTV
jgi:hypothetical protein